MFKQYSHYQASDYLTDDYFIDSMIEPTADSDAFWKALINDDKINVNEFISAYMTLKSLHENKPEVPGERIDNIWEHIVYTNRKKRIGFKRVQMVRYAAVACSIVATIGLSVFYFMKTDKAERSDSINDFARENTIHIQQPSNQIQVISGGNTLTFDGAQAMVEYDENGKLVVNQESVNESKQANPTKDIKEFNQLRVPYGKRAFLKLSDGTSLWVNTGSTVIYPNTFDDDNREIYVEGEVYAEVIHDAKRPFNIKTDKIDVQVLGTVLNVAAYRDDKQINVVLVKGSINVKVKGGKATIVEPGQLFEYSNQACTLRTVNVENFISWHEGKYIFQNEPIENILLRLSRYYNVTMILPLSASGITCSGKLELKDELSQLLNGLSEITSMTYAEKGNEYTILFN